MPLDPARPRCDECNTLKGETNHWFFVRWVKDWPTANKSLSNWIEIYPLTDYLLVNHIGLTLCSEGCLAKRISKIVGEWRKDSVNQNVG